MLLSDTRFYFMLIVAPLISLLPDFTLHAVQAIFYPEREHILMALQF